MGRLSECHTFRAVEDDTDRTSLVNSDALAPSRVPVGKWLVDTALVLVDIAWLVVETMQVERRAADTSELVLVRADSSAVEEQEGSTAVEIEVEVADRIVAEVGPGDRMFEDFLLLNGGRALVGNCRTSPVDLNASAREMEAKMNVLSSRKNSHRPERKVAEANTSVHRVSSTNVWKRDWWNSFPNFPVSWPRDNLSDAVDRASSAREFQATKTLVQNIRNASDSDAAERRLSASAVASVQVVQLEEPSDVLSFSLILRFAKKSKIRRENRDDEVRDELFYRIRFLRSLWLKCRRIL